VTTSSVILGTGMIRFGKFLDASPRTLATEAVNGALIDAGVNADDVGFVFCGNVAAGVLHGQGIIRGQSSLRHTGLLFGDDVVQRRRLADLVPIAAQAADHGEFSVERELVW